MVGSPDASTHHRWGGLHRFPPRRPTPGEGRPGRPARRPVDRSPVQHRAPGRQPGRRVRPRVDPQRRPGRPRGVEGRRDLPPGGGRGRQPDRREAAREPHDQHPRHRDRGGEGPQVRQADPRHLHLGDLRKEHLGQPVRGRRPHSGIAVEEPVVLFGGQGHRRDPGLHLLAREGPRDGHRAALQHRRPTPDRELRHGRAPVREPGTTK